MSTASTGIELPTGQARSRGVLELLASMRFAIALLTVICIASVIGTVLKQHEPVNNYINQFGPFWAEVFGSFQLYAVYSAWWFLLILAFLVTSTSLCIARNAPKILSDLRQFKENIREQSLRAFAHRAEALLPGEGQAEAERIGQVLLQVGWKVRLQRRESAQGVGWMVAAKAGAANKIGYLAAHSAIVLVCVGGLLDGDLIVRAQMWFQDKTPYRGGGLIAEVPEQHRLSERNPTFRGNVMVTEGTQSHTAILAQPDGAVLQELPFDIELRKFIVDYYSTGMPKRFASEVVIHDRATGEAIPGVVEVNKPLSHRGIEIYQSSFDDGGSLLKLKAMAMDGRANPLEVQGRVGGSTSLANGSERLTLEFSGLRVINVENFGGGAAASGTDVRRVDLREAIESRLGSADKTVTRRELRNVGPSVSYKLRDEAGQAREFHNYMLPVELDGQRVFLLGVRDTPSEAFRYVRLPADESDGIEGYVRLRAALADPAARQQAVQRYVRTATDAARPDLAEALKVSAQRAIDLFAGAGPVPANPVKAANGPDPATAAKTGMAARPSGGLQAVSDFLEGNVPQAERERAGDVLLRILNGTLFELAQLSRERAGLPPMARDERSAAFMTQSVIALSDSFFYPAPMAFMLQDFQQVQASVFQVARAPGRNIVYLGCLLLILGVFAMLYVRERRLWVWLVPVAGGAGVQATMALSSNRRTLDGDREFDTLKARLLSPAA